MYQCYVMASINWGLSKMKQTKKLLIPLLLLLVISILFSGCILLGDSIEEYSVKSFLSKVAKTSKKLDGNKIKLLYDYPIIGNNGEIYTETDVVFSCKLIADEYKANKFRVIKQKFIYENAEIIIEKNEAFIVGAFLEYEAIERKKVIKGNTITILIKLVKVNNAWKLAVDNIFVPELRSKTDRDTTGDFSMKSLATKIKP